jgi:hypothetical protein
MPRRAIRFDASRIVSSSSNAIDPSLRGTIPMIDSSVVVLPAPFGPISAWIEPRRTGRLGLFTAKKPLRSLVSPRVSTIVSSAAPSSGVPGAESPPAAAG